MNDTPVTIWWAKARARARYKYRWTTHQVSYLRRRRAALIEVTPPMTSRAKATAAASMSGYDVRNCQNWCKKPDLASWEYPRVTSTMCTPMSPSAQGAIRRCHWIRRSWPNDRSNQGSRATRTNRSNRRYAPVKPASRPPAMSAPPGAWSDPPLSPVITRANVIPMPRPARARKRSPNTRLGACPGRRPRGGVGPPPMWGTGRRPVAGWSSPNHRKEVKLTAA